MFTTTGYRLFNAPQFHVFVYTPKIIIIISLHCSLVALCPLAIALRATYNVSVFKFLTINSYNHSKWFSVKIYYLYFCALECSD